MPVSFLSPIQSCNTQHPQEKCAFLRGAVNFFNFGQKGYAIEPFRGLSSMEVAETRGTRPSLTRVVMRVAAITTLIIPALMLLGALVYKALNHFQIKPVNLGLIGNKDIEGVMASCMRVSDLCLMRSVSKQSRSVAEFEIAKRINAEEITLGALGIRTVADLTAFFNEGAYFIKRLDLQNFAIEDEDIQKLSQLFPSLTHLYLKDAAITNRSQPYFETMRSLKTLSLWGCLGITDLSFVRGCPLLNTLDIKDCRNITQIGFLQECTSISHLDLSCCDTIVDFNPLKYCRSLKTLSLYECYANVKTLDFLEECSSLESLDLSWCKKITDFSLLKHCPLLKNLILQDCHQIDNLNFLEHCPSLKSLSLSGCKTITDFSVLENLELESLDLAGCTHITDFGFIKRILNLKSLDLAGCSQVGDFSFLNPSLLSLGLSFCFPTDFAFLQDLPSLKSLGLAGADPSNFNFLHHLKKLESLSLFQCNGIEDFTFLQGSTSLKHLNLFRNRPIEDFSFLDQCPSLESLDLFPEQVRNPHLLRIFCDKKIKLMSWENKGLIKIM